MGPEFHDHLLRNANAVSRTVRASEFFENRHRVNRITPATSRGVIRIVPAKSAGAISQNL